MAAKSKRRTQRILPFCVFFVFFRLIDSLNGLAICVAENRLTAVSRVGGIVVNEAIASNGISQTRIYGFGTTCRSPSMSGAAGRVQIGQATERNRPEENPKEKAQLVFRRRPVNCREWFKLIH